MGQGLTLTLCPIPAGYHRRQDGSLVHPADAEAVIRERAEQLTDEQEDEILSRTGNDDPATYIDAIIEAWQTVVDDQHGDGIYCNVAELDLVDGGPHWVSGSINSGDYGCDEQEALTLLDASGVCEEPMPWYEAPAVLCGFPLFASNENPDLAALTCTLEPFHRGDKHSTMLGDCEMVTVQKNLPDGVDEFPPVVIVYVGGDFNPFTETHGCDPVIIIVDEGTIQDDEPRYAGILEAAKQLPLDHPARDELEAYVAEHQNED